MTIEQIVNSLSADGHWQVNKALARAVGIELAVLTSELVYKFRYWKQRGQLDSAGGFFLTSADLQDTLWLSERTVKRLTKAAQDKGLVAVKKRGVPAKNYWYISWPELARILENVQTSQAGTDLTGQDGTGPTGDAETGPTITKKTVPRKETKVQALPDGLYAQVVELFSKGYEALEKQKLSWVGKEKAYGNAVKTIIKQAMSAYNDSERLVSSAEILQEIQGRARAFLKAISAERAKGPKGNSWLAKKTFTPTAFMAVWNEFPPQPVLSEGPPRPKVEIPAEELARHREASGV